MSYIIDEILKIYEKDKEIVSEFDETIKYVTSTDIFDIASRTFKDSFKNECKFKYFINKLASENIRSQQFDIILDEYLSFKHRNTNQSFEKFLSFIYHHHSMNESLIDENVTNILDIIRTSTNDFYQVFKNHLNLILVGETDFNYQDFYRICLSLKLRKTNFNVLDEIMLDKIFKFKLANSDKFLEYSKAPKFHNNHEKAVLKGV